MLELGRYLEAPVDDENAVTLVSSGIPMRATNVRVDGTTLDGVLGELLVDAPTLRSATGIDESRLVRNEDGTWIRTGDWGFLNHGEVYVIGRCDDQINYSGKVIDPVDVENFVLKAVDGVSDAVLLGIEDEARGTRRLVLLVETSYLPQDHTTLASKIGDVLREGVQLVLHRIEMLPIGALTRSSTGKKSRSLSRKAYQS
jgi:acyl-coenzyme A synthetase/AMP-(fatty) acid ligase